MDFRKAQGQARRSTLLLLAAYLTAIGLFPLTLHVVACMMMAMIAGVGLLAIGATVEALPAIAWDLLWSPWAFLTLSAVTTSICLLGTLDRMVDFNMFGGLALLRRLNARQVNSDTREPAERVLINVVEELAIAAGLTMPTIHLLEREPGINAFVVGMQPEGAMIAVTAGALKHLDRDQLQGVAAHEFGHILNGDMRLNCWISGLVYGMVGLREVGLALMNKTASTVGVVLWAVGGAGLPGAALIKSAVRRNREYLADATAVALTRNPAGLAGALRRIAEMPDGARLYHPMAAEAEHMVIASKGSAWFDSHPPITDRLRRLGDSAPVTLARNNPAPATEIPPKAATTHLSPLSAAQALLLSLPAIPKTALSTTEGAQAVLFGLLMAGDHDAAALADDLARAELALVVRRAEALLPHLAGLSDAARLALLDLALPALRQLGPDQRQRFADSIARLVEADGQFSAFEITLAAILHGALHPGPVIPPTSAEIVQDQARLLATLARDGWDKAAGFDAAFARAWEALWDGAAARPEAPAPLATWDLAQGLARLRHATWNCRQVTLAAAGIALSHGRQVGDRERAMVSALAQALGVPGPGLRPRGDPAPGVG